MSDFVANSLNHRIPGVRPLFRVFPNSGIYPVSGGPPHLSGIFDKLVGPLGERFSRKVAIAQVRAWAGACAWIDEDLLFKLRKEWRTGEVRPESVWQKAGKSEQYLSGSVHPRRGTVDELAEALPGTRQVYDSLVWVALNPRTDLDRCKRIAANLATEIGVNDVLASFQTGNLALISEHLIDGSVIALLIVQLRLGAHDDDYCFQIAWAILLAILAFALAPGMRDAAERLWELVREVVSDIPKGEWRLRPKAEHFFKLLEGIDRRMNAVKKETGWSHVDFRARGLPYEVKLFLCSPILLSFMSPEYDAADRLDDILGMSSQHSSHEGWLTKNSVFQKGSWVQTARPT